MCGGQAAMTPSIIGSLADLRGTGPRGDDNNSLIISLIRCPIGPLRLTTSWLLPSGPSFRVAACGGAARSSFGLGTQVNAPGFVLFRQSTGNWREFGRLTDIPAHRRRRVVTPPQLHRGEKNFIGERPMAEHSSAGRVRATG